MRAVISQFSAGRIFQYFFAVKMSCEDDFETYLKCLQTNRENQEKKVKKMFRTFKLIPWIF